MAFRIGRRLAAHTYPASQGNSTLLFARNFAQGPGSNQTLTTSPQEIGWGSIESGAPAGPGVPVTPKITGLILINGVVEVENTSEVAVVVGVQVGVDGIAVPTPATEVTVPAGSFATVPIQALVSVALNVVAEINLFVSANTLSAITLQANDSTLSVKEVTAATG